MTKYVFVKRPDHEPFKELGDEVYFTTEGVFVPVKTYKLYQNSLWGKVIRAIQVPFANTVKFINLFRLTLKEVRNKTI